MMVLYGPKYVRLTITSTSTTTVAAAAADVYDDDDDEEEEVIGTEYCNSSNKIDYY